MKKTKLKKGESVSDRAKLIQFMMYVKRLSSAQIQGNRSVTIVDNYLNGTF